MATQPEIPPPDTINLQSPPEAPPPAPPAETPYREPPEIVPEQPDIIEPGRHSALFERLPPPTD